LQALLQNEIPRIRSRLERVLWSVQTQYPQKIKGAMHETRNRVAARTPKSTGKMASGWKVKLYGGGPKSRVPVAGRIYNEFAHGKRRLYQSRKFKARFTKLSTGRINTKSTTIKTDGRTVLRVLEFGSSPHIIRAAHVTKSGKPGFLAFTPWTTGSSRAGSSMSGGVVFARVVRHPGTKPYGMIRWGRAHLRESVRKINAETGAQAKAIMAGRG